MSKSSQKGGVPNAGEMFGHPKGLFILFFAEMWERFSYYGMRALLVLYMVANTREQIDAEGGKAGDAGLGWSQDEALSLYGTYTALVYLTPLIGGYLADKVLGQRLAVVIGGLLMVAGHFIMALSPLWAFYTALLLIIVGNGFFKPNISTIVGQLYEEGDERRDSAFTIFYMGINVGAFLAGIVCGWLQQEYGFHYGFAAAGVGMLFAQIVFQYNPTKFFGDIGTRPKKTESGEKKELSTYEKVLSHRIYMTLFAISALLAVGLTAFDGYITFSQSSGMEAKIAKNADTESVKAFMSAQGLTSDATEFKPGEKYTLSLPSPIPNTETSSKAAELSEADVFKSVDAVTSPLIAGQSWSFYLMLLISGGLIGLVFHFKSAAVKSEGGLQHQEKAGLTEALDRIYVIFILAIFTIFFWAGFEQAGGLMNIYTNDYTDRTISWLGDFEVPTAWFQSVNAFFIVVFAPVFSIIWTGLGRKGMDPATPYKMGIGLILLGVGFIFMVGSALNVELDAAGNAVTKGGMTWIVMAYMFHTLGELCLSPVGLSMVTKLAPATFASLLMGIWFLAIAAANKFAGIIGQFSAKLDSMPLFAAIAGGTIFFGLVLFLIGKKLHRMMHGRG